MELIKRTDCRFWSNTHKNHCVALANEYRCTEDCAFFKPIPEEKQDEKKNNDSVGARCRRARLLAGFNQGELAGILGISQSHLGNIEKGRKEPSKEFLIGLASMTNINPEWLKKGKGNMRL